MTKEEIIEKNSNEIRGGVLNYALKVETTLSECIGCLYTKDTSGYKFEILLEDIISDLTFDKKIRIFKKHINFTSENFENNKLVIKYLDEIRTIRNKIAHLNLSDPSWNVDSNWKTNCVFVKTGKEEFNFSLDDLKIYQDKCQSTIYLLHTILSKLLS